MQVNTACWTAPIPNGIVRRIAVFQGCLIAKARRSTPTDIQFDYVLCRVRHVNVPVHELANGVDALMRLRWALDIPLEVSHNYY